MSQFDTETAIVRSNDGSWTTHLAPAWNIGNISNGGYALTPVLRALRELTGQPDPLSVTTHFLRPARGDTNSQIDATLIRSGRTVATARGTLSQEGKERLVVIAAFGDVQQQVGTGPKMSLDPPDLPPVERCVRRSADEQGVELPLLSRADVYLHPDGAVAGGSKRPVTEGWIRFADGTEPSTLPLPFFTDAFPPALFSLLGNVGWVPTIELTVHVRRVPAPGWLLGRFECDDLHNGRQIETGALWDSTGELVARCRQIGLLLND
ncbi:MAG: thioesterase family protein [Planctomycetaceae bacterium]